MADIDSITFTIPNRSTLPTLTTQAVTVLSSSSAFGGGNISADGGSAVTRRGVCWNTSPNPTLANNFTVDGTGLGSYGSTMQPLTPATTYYVRAYATNANGTSYGSQVSFVTAPANNSGNLPTISTNQVVYIDSLSAFCGGNITADGGLAVTARGVCWAIGTTPTINNSRTIDGAGGGSFNSRLANLLPNTSYFVRAYATNAAGTAYGITYSFTTKGFATLATDSVYDIMALSAQAAGRVLSDGGVSVTERGFCWSLNSNPSVNDNKVLAGNGLGAFAQQIQSLSADTTIYVRAFARSSIGFSYGNQIAFRTQTGIPIVITDTVFDIGAFTANVTGNVLTGNGAPVNTRGFCWSLTPNPTIFDYKTNNGNGLGMFSGSLSNLLNDTIYYLRTYATTNDVTSYGNQISFRTQTGIPILVTDSVFNIRAFTANFSGNVLNGNGATINMRGFCWSLSPNPTINDSKTINGNGLGSFSSSLFDLLIDTVYYVRAYATTIAGSSYGNQISFRTSTYCSGFPTAIVNVTNAITGKTWMDRNLGAMRTATSSTDSFAFGDLYQWGRNADGHQCRNSLTTSNTSSTNQAGNSFFITNNLAPMDWRSPSNTNLWQGVNGINNPCPTGYRLPTESEINSERLSWASNNPAGAFASPLKFTMGGYRSYEPSGKVYDVSTFGCYWTSTVSGDNSVQLMFDSFNTFSAIIRPNSRAFGFSVRCIKN